MLHTFKKSNIIKFKISEKSLANKDTLKYPNKCNYCTKIQITKTPCTYSHTLMHRLLPNPKYTKPNPKYTKPTPHTDPPTHHAS